MMEEDKEPPAWVAVLPAASGLWSMILTFRERGSYDVADNLLAAAEKQWEVHLRTQKMIARRQTLCPDPSPRLRPAEERIPDVNSIIIKNYPSISEESDKEEENDNNLSVSKDKESIVEDNKERLPSHHTSVRCSPCIRSCATSPRSKSPISRSCSGTWSPCHQTTGTWSPDSGGSASEHTNTFDCYACYHARLKTYEQSKFRWVSPSPSQLSEAGFFFIGPRDKVQCFSCETHENQWKPAEDPWVRHTHSSPTCDYIIETRGLDFISAILSKVEKVKQDIINTYTRSNSGELLEPEIEFTKMKLKTTKTTTSGSGWQLDPYKERGVNKGGKEKRKKKKSSS